MLVVQIRASKPVVNAHGTAEDTHSILSKRQLISAIDFNFWYLFGKLCCKPRCKRGGSSKRGCERGGVCGRSVAAYIGVTCFLRYSIYSSSSCKVATGENRLYNLYILNKARRTNTIYQDVRIRIIFNVLQNNFKAFWTAKCSRTCCWMSMYGRIASVASASSISISISISGDASGSGSKIWRILYPRGANLYRVIGSC